MKIVNIIKIIGIGIIFLVIVGCGGEDSSASAGGDASSQTIQPKTPNAPIGSDKVKSFSSEHSIVQDACSRGVETACFEYGILLEEGLGVDKDIGEAKTYYLKACEGDYDKGCEAYKRLKGEKK